MSKPLAAVAILLCLVLAAVAAPPRGGSPGPADLPRYAREYTIEGHIKALDGKAGSITVKRDNGKETTLKVDNGTDYFCDGKPFAWGKLAVGQDVRVVFDLDTMHCYGIYVFIVVDRP